MAMSVQGLVRRQMMNMLLYAALQCPKSHTHIAKAKFIMVCNKKWQKIVLLLKTEYGPADRCL